MIFHSFSLALAGTVTTAALLTLSPKNTPDDETTSASTHLEQVVRGKAVYRVACASCHGTDGTGHGPISGNLRTRPRDFTKAVYKSRSTASGQLPTDEDLDRSITTGVHGSTMPAFERLAPEDRTAIVQYLKSLSPRFADSTEYPLDVLAYGPQIGSSPQSFALGRAIYLKMQCDNCHGTNGRGDGQSAAMQHDDFGDFVHTTDLTLASDYKFAHSVKDVYRIFSTGMNGVAMPSFASTLQDTDRWHLANYVWSLAHPAE